MQQVQPLTSQVQVQVTQVCFLWGLPILRYRAAKSQLSPCLLKQWCLSDPVCDAKVLTAHKSPQFLESALLDAHAALFSGTHRQAPGMVAGGGLVWHAAHRKLTALPEKYCDNP